MRPASAKANREFFMRRLAQEEAAERAALNPRARKSHREMAKRYRDECAAETGSETVLISR